MCLRGAIGTSLVGTNEHRGSDQRGALILTDVVDVAVGSRPARVIRSETPDDAHRSEREPVCVCGVSPGEGALPGH